MDERIGWMILGGAIGFILGYIVAHLRKIEDKVEEVDAHLMGKTPRDEGGFITSTWVSNLLLLLFLGMVVLGVWRTNETARDVTEVTDIQTKAIVCNAEYLNAQAQFLRIYLEEPPATEPEQRAAIDEFVALLDAYAANDGVTLLDSPYRNKDALRECVEAENTERLTE